jgi:hypothetical protein
MTSSSPDNDLTYSYKPSMVRPPYEFRLAPDALEWIMGTRRGRLRYRDVHSLRLMFRPATLQTHRFLAEVRGPTRPVIRIASSSWRSMLDFERHDSAYAAFMTELHRRISAARPDFVFDAGSPPWIYWPGAAVFVVLGFSIVALTVRALQVGQWAGAAMVGAFLLLFLWQIGAFFRRNRPRRYRGDDIPADILP